MEAESTQPLDISQEIENLVRVYSSLCPFKFSPVDQALLNATNTILSYEGDIQKPAIEKAYMKLPVVDKKLETGPRGGLRYINKNGKVVWLKKYQRNQCKNGTLKGVQNSCPPDFREYNKSNANPDCNDGGY